MRFLPCDALRAANSSLSANDRAALAGLTTRQRCDAFWIDPEPLHHFKTTAPIALRRGDTPLSGEAAS
jgi:hypothetical protein